MRKVLSIFAVIGLAVAIAQAQTGTSGKTASSWKCAAPNPVNALPVGDAPDHVYAVQQVKCTATKGEIAGIAEKEGAATEFLDGTATAGKGHGMFVETLANGDKLYVSYEFTGVVSNKVFQSGSNTWTVTGGTGKFAGAKGNGTCKAKGNPDGSANFDCSGTYTLAK